MTGIPTTDPDSPALSRRRPASAPVPASRTVPVVAALVSGTIFLLSAAVLVVLVLNHPERPLFQGMDDQWLRWMGGPHDGVYAAVAAVLNWLGGPLGVVVPLGIVVFLAARRRWRSLAFLLTTYLVGNVLVVQALKHLVDRPRPADPLVRVDHGSFPSGHAAGMALLVVLVGALFVPAARRRMWWLFGSLLVLAMMWSRTWLHAHWLSDTFAGAVAGAGTGLVLWSFFARLLERERRLHED
ncbi:phosphatase PAP2 family protein [Streptomyces sp. NPDC058877]|uniref:phosphatase PAP2 family protein n=1 Tax=unclassified Streptomyces TaxID=2593676 RepID=UPI00369F01FA